MIIEGKELSEETVKKACEAYGISFEEEKFEPISIHCGCFIVDVEGTTIKITIGSNHNGICCFQCPSTTREFIAALQSAIDYIESE